MATAAGFSEAPELLGRLLQDDDVGVRKQALASATGFRDHDEVRARLETIASSDAQEALRRVADRVRRGP